MKCVEFADEVAVRLESLMGDLPEEFHGSFRFTQTGNNLTHPITLGYLSQIL